MNLSPWKNPGVSPYVAWWLMVAMVTLLPGCGALMTEDDRVENDAFWAEQLILTEREERRMNGFQTAWDRALEDEAPSSWGSWRANEWGRRR
jgi:hypothetical protein